MTTSSIVKLSAKLNKYFLSSYTYKVVRVILNWCRYSEINQFIIAYLERSSSLKYSVTYRIFSKVFFSIDKVWDIFYDFAVNLTKTSYVISFIRRTFCGSSSSLAYSLFILFFSCGFGVTSISLGTFNNIKAVLLALGFLVAILLLVGKSSWVACRKGSLFWRIALYIFD